jgi:hypothetical protein
VFHHDIKPRSQPSHRGLFLSPSIRCLSRRKLVFKRLVCHNDQACSAKFGVCETGSTPWRLVPAPRMHNLYSKFLG